MIAKLRIFPKLKTVRNLVESLTLAQLTNTTTDITAAAVNFWATSDRSSQLSKYSIDLISNEQINHKITDLDNGADKI